jgi:hypothetical protein
MKQIARKLTDAEEGFFNGKRYVLMDRDTKFCEDFRNGLQSGGVESVRLPPRSPNCNAHLERFMRSLKEECLERMIFFGEESLRQETRQFLGSAVPCTARAFTLLRVRFAASSKLLKGELPPHRQYRRSRAGGHVHPRSVAPDRC